MVHTRELKRTQITTKLAVTAKLIRPAVSDRDDWFGIGNVALLSKLPPGLCHWMRPLDAGQVHHQADIPRASAHSR